MLTRRQFVAQAAGLVALAKAARPLLAAAGDSPLVTVYKTSSCTCCAKWVDHIEKNGFRAEVHDLDVVEPVKDRLGVPKALRSCHTGVVAGYVVEGHVPAADLRRLLKERPHWAGLAAPGMPPSAPGMYQPGEPVEPYEVIAFAKTGATERYASH